MKAPRRRALVWGIPGGLLLLIALLVGSAPSAEALMSGPCEGSINGQDLRGRITVPENGTVAWNFTLTEGFAQHWFLNLHYVDGFTYEIASGIDPHPDKSSISGVANVEEYAEWGAGVYELVGVVYDENRNSCTGRVEIVVQGNPLTTVVGGIAASVAAIGVGGGTAAAIGAAKGALAGLP